MDTRNIHITRLIINILSLIAFLYQLVLFENFEDFLCIFIIFISCVLTTNYCFNNNFFFKYPFSLLIIFFSHFINLGGALYLKSFELTLISDQLRFPLITIFNLALFNLLIILSHSIYRNMNGLSIIHNSINNLLEKFRFNDFKKPNLFYVISALAISTRLFNFNVDVSIDETRTVDGNINLLQDVFNGFKYLLFLPVVIFFANSLYDTKYSNKKNIFYVIYLILLLIFSFSFNNRSIFFDAILLSALIIFILFLFSKIKIDKFFVLKFFFFLFIIAPSLNFIENLSLRFINERSLYLQRTPIENLESFVSGIFDKKKSIYSNKKKTYKQTFFIEEYYSKGIFNRINILIVHDNFIFLKSVLSKNQIQGVKDLQVGKIISVLPGPVIRVFNKDFEKSNFLQYSTASYLYGIYDVMYGNLNIGSALMTLYLIFNKWLYFMLLFLFIPTFIFFDSFFNKKLMIFSPFILIFFYSTSGGVLNFFAASDISIWFTLIFRSIPQTFLIVLILNFILQKIIKINE